MSTLHKTIENLKKENAMLRDALEFVKYTIASCQAGDGDDSTWEEAALYARVIASKALRRLRNRK